MSRRFSFIVLLFFALFVPAQGYYETLQLEWRAPLVRASEFDNFVPSKYPKRVGKEKIPQTSAKSVVIRDLESGVTLYSYNPEIRLPMASITKLMTALVALDYYSTEDILDVKRLAPAKGESEMDLAVGDKVTVKNLIYGLLVPSGNDAAYTLADNYPGGIENFIYSMNKKAENLHLNNTHFENPSGLDNANHFSSAKDLSLLTVEALKNSLISEAVTTYGITLSDADKQKFYPVRNVNQFLGYLFGADGVKTGFTDAAGQCLVASVSRNGHRVVSVILGSQDRFGDSARMLEWVYRNYDWINP